jgi:hypothetical protein
MWSGQGQTGHGEPRGDRPQSAIAKKGDRGIWDSEGEWRLSAGRAKDLAGRPRWG